MTDPAGNKLSDEPFERAALEFRYEAAENVSLSELAASFRAIDDLYARTSANGERLSVVEIRAGSILAVFEPFLPLLGQSLEVMNAVSSVLEFSKKIKVGMDWLSGRRDDSDEVDTDVASDLAQIIKPLSGKDGAAFGVASFRYRSRTKKRFVDIEATYGSADLNRAYVNAERVKSAALEIASHVEEIESQPTLLRRVKMVLHQANAGPAKSSGQTGDRGIIKEVSDKKLPVYFAGGINDLKDKMVKRARNPLKGAYIVDVIVTRERGEPKRYTVIDVHAAARATKEQTLPLLQVRRPGRRIS